MAEGFPQIVITAGPDEGKAFPLPKSGTILIGRTDECAIQLGDSSVSRRHGMILARDGRYFLRDELSRNGTILEGRRLSSGEEVSLSHLDEFQMGIFDLRFAEKPFTPAELKAKQRAEKPVPQAPPPAVPPAEAKPPTTPPADDTREAESLIEGLLEERDHVEENIPKKRRMRPGTWILLIALVISGAFATALFRRPIARFLEERLFGRSAPAPMTEPRGTPALKKLKPVAPSDNDARQTASSDNALRPLSSAEGISDNDSPLPPVLPLTPAGTGEGDEFGEFSIFLDVTTEPFPAALFFEDKRLGMAPLKANVMVRADTAYALYADFELRDIADIYREKTVFKARPDADVMEIDVKAAIGTLKIMKLPQRVQFYLEGYYDYDKPRANPVKLTDIRYGKPVYLPYGKYTVELREQTSVAGSENLITQIRYQREFAIGADNPVVEISVTDRDLKYFPAVIKSDPTGAEVYYEDEKVGATPLRAELPVGKGRLKIAKDGFFDKIVDLDMRMNSVYETTVTLETSKVGSFIVHAKGLRRDGRDAEAVQALVEALKYGGSAREKAEVYFQLGDAYLALKQYALSEPYFEKARAHADFAPRASLGLAKVFHALQNDAKALTTVVEVLANLDAESPPSLRGEANETFKKISAIQSVIYVYSEPPGANVFLNDRRLEQTTPLVITDLGLGNYRLEIEKPGYLTYRTKQTLKLGEFVMVKARLEKEPL